MSKHRRHIPELEIGDPLDHWLRQAYAFAGRLNLPMDFVSESQAIVKGAFTREGLDRIFGKKYPRDGLVPRTAHRMDTLFTVAGPSQVVEVMELAVYIKRLVDCENLCDVIELMKNSYATGLLQLAYAYRFRRAGAKNVRLEPETDRGRADIYYEYNGRPYLVECYVPELQEKLNSPLKLHKALRAIFDGCGEAGRKFRICIRLKDNISSRQGEELGYRIADRVREIGQEGTLEFKHQYAEVTLAPLVPGDDARDFPKQGDPFVLYGDADLAVDQYAIPTHEIPAFRMGRATRRKQGSRVFIWAPECERDELSADRYVTD